MREPVAPRQDSWPIDLVNTGSRNNDALNRYGNVLAASLEDLNLELVTVWLIAGNRDCLELLQDYAKVFPTSRIDVLRNMFGRL